ncbi:MAG: alpha-N-acetylglucosaminidase C-terminal domain-containing protein [Clostridia bacterium]|nr:alpha-N-acetylglucosaminidase C-terminal domain-containing protein [Clostridia bacterium]
MDLISRIAPQIKDCFIYEIVEKTTEQDWYGYKTKDGKICLSGTDNVCIAKAFGKYLENCLNKKITPCCGDMGEITEAPLPEKEFSAYIPQKLRVFGDYTLYSNDAWKWNFEKWEKFLDTLAINGINMAVNLVGNEGVCFYTLIKMDFPQDFALEFVSGPAFYSWQMSNRFYNYIPSKTFEHIERNLEMGKKVVARMKELGITPILSTFSGLVPDITTKLFGAKEIIVEDKWAAFAKTYKFRIDSPSFRRFFLKYLEVQDEYLGTSDYYLCNQLCASSAGTKKKEIAYLENAAKELDRAADFYNENATLVFSSEGYRPEFMSKIKRCNTLVLDIDSAMHEKANGFNGCEFILGNSQHNNSHNSMQGDIDEIADNPYLECKEKYPNAVGAGLFPENLNQNPMFFALSFDVLTEKGKIDLTEWYKKYEIARYGTTDDNAEKRLSLYRKTCYSKEHSAVPVGSAICTRPQLNLRHTGLYDRVEPLYDNDDLLEIYRSLRKLDCDNEAYRYDVINIAKQLLDNIAFPLHGETANAYRERKMEPLEEKSQKFLGIIDDVNEMLVCHKLFNASCYIDELKKLAETDDELTYFIINYIASIGLWGPMIEDNQRYDYGWQLLGNFLPCYQKIRWQKFFEHISGQFKFLGFQEKSRKQINDRDIFTSTPFYSDMARFEQGVILTFNPPEFEEKDTLTICDNIVNKYFS